MRHSLITNLTLLIRGGCQLVPDIRHGTDFNFDRVFSLGDNPSTPGGGVLPDGIGWYRKHFVKTNITTK